MGLEQQPALETPHPRDDCPFCTRHHLHNILEESQSFFLLADHAPLIEGHILLVPKAHYSCYGTVPPDLEPEFLLMKARATAFLRQAYRAPIFFEHGIFRQTVFHAHLHCFPFGKVELDLAVHHPHPAPHLKDVRDWYAEKGQYFYFEQRMGEGQLFLPEEVRYFSVLGALRQQAATYGTWQSPAERREHGRPKIASLVQKWHDFAQEEQDEPVRESSPDPIGRAQHKGENINGDGD